LQADKVERALQRIYPQHGEGREEIDVLELSDLLDEPLSLESLGLLPGGEQTLPQVELQDKPSISSRA
jgi:hypothetical protein